jgi:uncharacterized protein YbjT (DUF2867 family)
MITVMGATGHTGGEVARLLLAAGERVRAIGRSPGKLAALERAGAEVRAGDAADPAFLTAAFAGAAAVYTLLPFDPGTPDHVGTQRRLGEAIVRAVRDADVVHVVALSAVGADQPSGTGFIVSLHDQEERLRRLDGAAVLILRSGLFFETFAAALPLIEREGINADTVSPDVPLPMVATRDVAAVAAEALRARDWQGVVVREVLGQRDLTYREVTRILGERLGEPDHAYVRLAEADMAAALMQEGFSESAARLQVEMARAFNEGRVTSREGRTAQNTTPTRFEDFAAELVRAYRAG